MRVDRSDTGLTATDYTPEQLAHLERNLTNNNMDYTIEGDTLTVTFDDMYANLPQVNVPVPVTHNR